MLFLWLSGHLFGQDVGDPEMQKVTVKDWNMELFINTSGFGIGFQKGRTPDYFNKHFWEIDFTYNKHQKAVRVRNLYYEGTTSFSYGKLYNLFFLHGGYGYQRTIHHKPYWGGVQIRYTLSGGVSLGVGIPTYLKIAYLNTSTNSIITVVERYDPEKHNVNNIIGGASFWKGFSNLTIRPGFYVKTGLQFDFGQKETSIQAVEVGLAIDMIFPYLQQMAYNKAKPFYLCAYIAYNFGKKKGNYE